MLEDPAVSALVYATVYNLTLGVIDLVTSFTRQDSIYAWPFLLSALAIGGVGHLMLRGRGGILRDSLSWRVLWHRSSRADYRWFVVNTVLYVAAIAPFVAGTAEVADAVATGLTALAGPAPAAAEGGATIVTWRIAYTILFFVAWDFGRFLAHWLQHVVPLLWQFHKVHHSAECLNVLTSSRAHPVDLTIMALGGGLFGGLATGVVFYLAGAEAITPYVFLGQHVLIAAYNLIGTLRHTHVWLGYGRLERWLISPAMHQLHHSALPEHWNRNNGFALAFWDRLFGTWHPTRDVAPFPMGLGDGTDGQWHSVWRLYVWPFRDALALMRRRPPPAAAPGGT